MSAVVFIPTRNRIFLLERTIPKWLKQENVGHIHLVVEKSEYDKYKEFAKPFANVSVLRLPKVNQGVNYSRNWIVRRADDWGYNRIIMSDDDIYPRPSDDVSKLLDLDDVPSLGMGIMLPFYGLMFGNKTIKQRSDPLMSLGGLGKRLFSLDVQRALDIGNFDVKLYSGWGDDELVRKGIARQGYTWYIHAGVNGTSIAGRHTPGGLNDLANEDMNIRRESEHECHKLIYERWPKYVNRPKVVGGRLTCQWKKMFNDYVPNWRDRITWVKK